MARRPTPPAPKKRVWRISEAAPLGEFVDPEAADKSTKPADDNPPVAEASTSGGWIVSSFELLDGVDVDASDTVPDELFDEFFASPPIPDGPPAE